LSKRYKPRYKRQGRGLKTEIRIAGLGGQGVVLAGHILGKAAAYDGKKAVQTQSYGAEARGSMAKSEVIISDDKIGFPTVMRCDILVVMKQEALDKYLKDLKTGGTLIIDSTSVKPGEDQLGARLFRIPATENAEKIFGTKVYANMLMLGALAAVARVVSDSSLEKAIRDTAAKKTVDMNIQAYRKGKELVR
jgi:2-oxoglutarate ferredoxin oxidoreductase subunit gamma